MDGGGGGGVHDRVAPSGRLGRPGASARAGGAGRAARRLSGIDGLALPPEPPEWIDLVFVSPAVSSGEGANADPATLLTGAGHRFEGLARWQEVTLAGTDWQGLAAAIRRLDPRWLTLNTITWPRGSRRQGRSVPMRGVIGRLRLG